MDCEFCLEFTDERKSKYRLIYGPAAPRRLVARTQGFAALPTLGQLFAGSLLFVPYKHIETLTSLTPDEIRELSGFVEQTVTKIRHLGHPILFEHGARQSTGGGCGIYHAHLHLVPTPSQITWEALVPFKGNFAIDLATALQELRTNNSDDYILLGNESEGLRFATIPKDMFSSIGSQYFRQRLAELFGLHCSWNWRDYELPQPELLTTLELFI